MPLARGVAGSFSLSLSILLALLLLYDSFNLRQQFCSETFIFSQPYQKGECLFLFISGWVVEELCQKNQNQNKNKNKTKAS